RDRSPDRLREQRPERFAAGTSISAALAAVWPLSPLGPGPPRLLVRAAARYGATGAGYEGGGRIDALKTLSSLKALQSDDARRCVAGARPQGVGGRGVDGERFCKAGERGLKARSDACVRGPGHTRPTLVGSADASRRYGTCENAANVRDRRFCQLARKPRSCLL